MNSGAAHTESTTAANAADITELHKLLRKEDRVIFADAGYTSDDYRSGGRHLGLRWCGNDKRRPISSCRDDGAIYRLGGLKLFAALVDDDVSLMFFNLFLTVQIDHSDRNIVIRRGG